MTYPYWTVGLTALLVNIPLGYIRQNAQKFSLSWLFWIHASIPLIIYLRIRLDVSSWFIPISIALAVAGHLIGGRWRQSELTDTDKDRYEFISDLGLPQAKNELIHDEDVLVVLMNMGGPKTNADVPEFQRRLFNDPLLIRFPLSGILQPLFAWLLVTLRGKETQERYKDIGGGSPIFESTRQQTEFLKNELRKRGRNFDIVFSFNYSEPLPEETICEAKEAEKRYILPVSLYPHYSSATTGSNIHYLKKEAAKLYPEVKFLKSSQYHTHYAYIQAFVERIQEQLQPGESLDDFYLVFSAHGLPLYFLTEGDPYPFQISQTVGSVLTELKRDTEWTLCYQSAVGPLQWLKPSTDAVLESLAKKGVKKVIVVPIAFVTDHIETTCEIDMEYREMAEGWGIKDFRMSKALECHPGFISALADTVETALPSNAPKENKDLFNDFTSRTETIGT